MSNLIDKMLAENPDHGTAEDNGIWAGSVRCLQIEAIFWKYRGRKLPARAKHAIKRAEAKYLKMSSERGKYLEEHPELDFYDGYED